MARPPLRVLLLTGTAGLGVVVGGVAAASRSISVTVATTSRVTRPIAREARPIMARQRSITGGGGIVTKGPVHASAWLVAVELIVFAAAVLLLAVLAVPAARRWRDEVKARRGEAVASGVEETPADAESERERLRSGVKGALEVLDEEHDARAAVIVCWTRLEAAVAGAGAARGTSETSGELTARVLGSYAVDAADLRALHGSYRKARFSSAPLEAGERDEARQALVRLSGALSGPR